LAQETTAQVQRSPGMDSKLEEMFCLLQQQQQQLDTLCREYSALMERNMAMYECLEDSGLVKPGAFLARLHRRNFARTLERHPCDCRQSFETLLQTREMTISMARLCGPESTTTLSAASRTFSSRVREAQDALAEMFSPAVYVVGGEGADGDVTSIVERLDPMVGSWQPVESLPAPRAYCAAVALACRINVLGGCDLDGAVLNTVERYDPRQNTWEHMPAMQVARVALAAAAIDSRLCAVGGNNELAVHDSAEYLALEAGQWSPMPQMLSPRWAAAASAIGRTLYVIGGRDADDEVLSTMECFEQERNCWVPMPPLRTPRAALAAAAVGGMLYVVGGYDTALQDLRSLERFDPSAGSWQQLKPMGAPRFALGALACGGSLYVLGGVVGDVDRVVLGTVDRYDPKVDMWSISCPLWTPRRRFGAAVCC